MDETFERLARLSAGKRIVALTGAGCSTESGIPDYRGPETRRRAKQPIQFRTFMDDPAARARYWARSAVGWPKIANARPNAAHESLARLEESGALLGVLTQNVDGLHTAAGARNVIELHGALRHVKCLVCEAREPRDALQKRLLELNPGLKGAFGPSAPDGDADVSREGPLSVPSCLSCGGTLKPDVVFFGENIPRPRLERAYAMFDRAEALWIIGSSLAVFSGYRWAKRASMRGMPIAIVNLGPTRGDALAELVIEQRAGEVLPRAVDRLLDSSAA